MDRLNLSELPQALRHRGYTSLSYRRIYSAVLDGALADHVVRDNGRWYVSRDAVPAIAKALGLSKHQTAAA